MHHARQGEGESPGGSHLWTWIAHLPILSHGVLHRPQHGMMLAVVEQQVSQDQQVEARLALGQAVQQRLRVRPPQVALPEGRNEAGSEAKRPKRNKEDGSAPAERGDKVQPHGPHMAEDKHACVGVRAH